MASSDLLAVYLAAARNEYPPEDGGVEFVPAPAPGLHAILAFTAHAIIATDHPEALDGLELDGYGSALHPEVQQRLAGDARIGVLDVTLVAHGVGGGTLARRHDLDEHQRVRYARRLRTEVDVYGDERGLITLGTSLGGRREMSIAGLRPGAGRELIREALALTPAGEPLFAAVSPGNTRSLRAFLATGFVPIGSELVIGRLSG